MTQDSHSRESHSHVCFQRRQQRGFGLLESLIAISIMALLFLGAMTLLISTSRTAVRTQAQVYAVADSANSIQNVIGQLREASGFTLPTSNTANTAETGWIQPSGIAQNQFWTTLNGATINTAIEISAPPLLTPAGNGYTATVSAIQVLSTTGGTWASNGANWSAPPFDVSGTGTAVTLIYRGDPDGTPDADPTNNPNVGAGTYLWQYTLPANNSFNLTAYPPTILCKSVGTAPNAVQFVRPSYGLNTDPSQLEVKVISSYYSPINGQQTSEEGNGASSSQLVGKCVYMRDHNPTGKPPPNSATMQSNDPFQYH
jgi:prepilin-type N-terminal cleavage/methylation domain-containing protein